MKSKETAEDSSAVLSTAGLCITDRLIDAYRRKRAVDGLNGRTWNAVKHFAAEAEIDRLEQLLLTNQFDDDQAKIGGMPFGTYGGLG